MYKAKATAVAMVFLYLNGCGGSSSQPADTNILTGVFIDSAVGGVSYTTPTQSGVTDEQGRFHYLAGEQITFSIGATMLPTVAASPQVSPVDMGAASVDPEVMTTNIARLLQSLDIDGNLDNGITISETAAATASTIEFNVTEEEFVNDPAVINLVANSASITTTLISASEANEHLADSLGTSTNAGTDEQPANEIVLDLRGTTWLSSNELGCDGFPNTIEANYSQTGVEGKISTAEGNPCTRMVRTITRTTFQALNDSGGFLLSCEGDGLCTQEELNRQVLVSPGESRYECGNNGPLNYSISHRVGSDTITIVACNPEPEIYVRQ